MTDQEATEDRPSDTMRERVPESSRKFWVLLNTDRSLVAGGILAVFFFTLLIAGEIVPIPSSNLFIQQDPLKTLFQGLLGSIITAVTLVLTLSQIVLSQEQGPVGDQRDRMEGAMSLRKDVEQIIEESVSLPQPSAFLYNRDTYIFGQ